MARTITAAKRTWKTFRRSMSSVGVVMMKDDESKKEVDDGKGNAVG